MALSLENAPGLKVLHLKRNKLGGAKAMEALGKMLGSQHGLRELVLSENLIGTSLGYLAVPCAALGLCLILVFMCFLQSFLCVLSLRPFLYLHPSCMQA